MLSVQRLTYFIYCCLGIFPSMSLMTIDVGVPYSIRYVHLCGLILLCLILVGANSRAKLWEFGQTNISFVVLLVIAALTPLLATEFFAGLPVMNPRIGIDAQIAQKTPLAIGWAQAAHVTYFVLGVLYVAGAYVLLGRQYQLRFGRLLVGLGIVVISFSAWQFLANRYDFNYSNLFLYSNQRLEHIWHTSNNRVMGTFSEPSLLAAYLVGYIGILWALCYKKILSVWLASLLLLLSVLFLYITESMTGFLGFILCAFLSLIIFIIFWNDRRIRLVAALLVTVTACFGLVVFWLYPTYFDTVFIEKVKGGSVSVRGYADLYSLTVLRATNFLGVGLGTNATNSLMTYVASSLGLIGLVAFLYVLIKPFILIFRATGMKAASIGYLPVFSLVFIMSLSVPSLDFPPLWIALAWVYLEAWND